MFIQEIFLHLFLLIVGFILLIKGASFFADGAAAIASKLRVPRRAAGMAADLLAVSVPGAGISIAAAWRENPDIAAGNIIGGNMISLLLIAGLAALISPLSSGGSVRTELTFMMISVVFFTVYGTAAGEFSAYSGIFMICLFTVFLLFLFIRRKKEKGSVSIRYRDEAFLREEKEPSGRLFLFAVIGLVAVVLGSDLAVENAASAAVMIGVSERFFALTLISLGTSLPVLITCIRAVLRGHFGTVTAQITGRVLFRTLFVAGASGLAGPVVLGGSFLTDSILCVAAAAVFLFFCRRGTVSRSAGFLLLILYAAYLFYLLCC